MDASQFRPALFALVALVIPPLLAVVSAHHDGAEPARTSVSAAQIHQEIAGHDGAPLILIPAGPFFMGSETGQEDEKPIHRIELDAFYIDKYEVTVSRYGRFLQAQSPDRPFLWKQATEGAQGQKPVIGVDWFDAKEYCEWVGRRLPTEAEWEKAARSDDQRIYPWGNEPPTRAHANAGRRTWTGYGTLGAVGSHARGSSPYGVDDLAGNVWEWIADWYDQTYYASGAEKNPRGPKVGPLRVLRGGAWNDDAAVIRATNRAAYAPSARRNDVGFRCAMNADQIDRLRLNQ
jgi:formylglycine-generating enzyme